jgi:hypothetical protein
MMDLETDDFFTIYSRSVQGQLLVAFLYSPPSPGFLIDNHDMRTSAAQTETKATRSQWLRDPAHAIDPPSSIYVMKQSSSS